MPEFDTTASGLLIPRPNYGAAPPQNISESMRLQGMGFDLPFSPAQPIAPWFGYDQEPRAYNFQTGYNLFVRPRSGRITFDTIRELVNRWDIARLCVRHRIKSYMSFKTSIIPAEGEKGDVSTAIDEAQKFMSRPDGRWSTDGRRIGGKRMKPWFAQFLLGLFRYDAPTLYKRRSLGGQVIALEVVDGSTIAPMLDYDGRLPDQPGPGYVQYVNGLPWVWLNETELIYEPMFPQDDSPYGWAPIEDVIVAANTDLRMNMGLLEHWTDGNTAAGWMKPAGDITDPEKIKQIQADYDAKNKEDQRRKQQVRWIMSGTEFIPFREEHFDEDAYLWQVRKGCAAYGVVPQDLGLTMDVNRANGETQMDVQERIGDAPVAEHVDGILTSFFQDDMGWPLQFKTSFSAEKEDRLQEAQVWKIGIDAAAVSSSEMRENMFGLEEDNERPVPRGFMTTRGGFVPLTNVFQIAGPVDPETKAPTDDVALPQTPYEGAAGILPSPTLNKPGALVAGFNPDQPGFPENPVPPAPSIIPAAPVSKADGEAPWNDGLPTIECAGLVVRAADTGRVLMLQRALSDGDPAGGTWEFPGGHLEPGETCWDAAFREWQEETGIVGIGVGEYAGCFTAGTYRGFVWEVPSESELNIALDTTGIVNPDGDQAEALAWWSPSDAQANPALRPECVDNPWDLIAGPSSVLKDESAGMTSTTGIVGVDVLTEDDDDDEEEDEITVEVRKDLRRWRENSRDRVKAGKRPRLFGSTVIPSGVMLGVWKSLEPAKDRSGVDAAFPMLVSGVAKAQHPLAVARKGEKSSGSASR